MKHGAPPRCGLNEGRMHEVSFRSSSGCRDGRKLRQRRQCRRRMRTRFPSRPVRRMPCQCRRGCGEAAGGRGGASRARVPLWHRLALRTLPGLLRLAKRTKAKPRASGVFVWQVRVGRRPIAQNSEGGKSRPQTSLNSNAGANGGDDTSGGGGASPNSAGGGDANPNAGDGASPSDGGPSPGGGHGPSPGGGRGPSALPRV